MNLNSPQYYGMMQDSPTRLPSEEESLIQDTFPQSPVEMEATQIEVPTSRIV